MHQRRVQNNLCPIRQRVMMGRRGHIFWGEEERRFENLKFKWQVMEMDTLRGAEWKLRKERQF